MKSTFRLTVANKTSTKPLSRPKVLVLNTRQGLIYFEPDEQLGQQEQVMPVKEIIEVLLNRLLYIFLVNTTNTDVLFPRVLITG